VSRLAALGMCALALCCLASACGGKSTARRDAVATYILKVDTIEQRLSKPLLDVSKANRDFAKGRGASPKARRELAQAEVTIATLQRRLAAVKPPPDAAALHALVLQFVASEKELAGEVARLATFLPAFTGALTLLAGPNAELKHALGTKKATLDERAAALDRYRAELVPVIAKLRRLDPPPSSRPVWQQQIATLVGVQASVEALASALRAKRYAAIPRLLHRLNVASVTNQSVAAQKAQIAAVTRYNDRIAAVSALGRKIANETARLQRTLG